MNDNNTISPKWNLNYNERINNCKIKYNKILNKILSDKKIG